MPILFIFRDKKKHSYVEIVLVAVKDGRIKTWANWKRLRIGFQQYLMYFRGTDRLRSK